MATDAKRSLAGSALRGILAESIHRGLQEARNEIFFHRDTVPKSISAVPQAASSKVNIDLVYGLCVCDFQCLKQMIEAASGRYHSSLMCREKIS